MNNPFEVLGLKGWANQDEIRSAYRALVKRCHPDMIQDPVLKEEAQERMVRLNLAYEEASRLASPKTNTAPAEEIPPAAAVLMAERSLARNNPGMLVRTNENVNRANRMVEALAQEFGFRYIDVNDGLKDDQGNLKIGYTSDGIHFGAAAYRTVFDRLKQYLQES